MATGILIDAALASLGDPTARMYAWSALLVGCLFLVLARSLSGRGRFWSTFLFSVVVPFGATWHCYHDSIHESATIIGLLSDESQPVIVDATLDRPVALRRHPLANTAGQRRRQAQWRTQFEVSLRSILIRGQSQPCSGRMIVGCDGRIDQLLPGDQLRIFGSMQAFPAPSNPGEIDLRPFYRRRGLHGRIDCDREQQIQKLDAPATGWTRWFYRPAAIIAASGRDTLLSNTSEQVHPLALALIMGQRELIEQDTRDTLLETGTAHLLSVSGLHLAIVVGLVAWLGSVLRFPKRIQLVLIFIVALLYTGITGARPPVVRAAVLIGAFVFSMMLKRPRQPLNILSAAALFLMVWNPENVFSVGVHLSFLAVATLMMANRKATGDTAAIQDSLEREERLDMLADTTMSLPIQKLWSGFRKGRELLWFSGSVSLMTLPLVWQQFNVVSVISILINVLMGLLLVLALPLGVATVVAGWVNAPLAGLLGKLCDLSLQLIQTCIGYAAELPLSHFWLPSPPTYWVVCFYAALLISLWWQRSRFAINFRRLLVPVWGLAAYFLATAAPPLEQGSLEATFVDIGHGTCVILRFSEDEIWLYDCGHLANENGSSRDIDTALWSLGITHIDGIFLSHADADHYNALPGVLRRFSVRRIVTAPKLIDTQEHGLVPIRDAIDRYTVPIEETFAGHVVTLGEHPVQVLHPPKQGIDGSDNANSLTLLIGASRAPLILPGDLESPGTAQLIGHARPRAGSVLMAPHHGSLATDARGVCEWSRPSQTIVSGGKRARRPAVREMLSFTGSGVHVTANLGAIRVTINKSGNVEVRSWKRSPW